MLVICYNAFITIKQGGNTMDTQTKSNSDDEFFKLAAKVKDIIFNDETHHEKERQEIVCKIMEIKHIIFKIERGIK